MWHRKRIRTIFEITEYAREKAANLKNMPRQDYRLPPFLEDRITPEDYRKWLFGKAKSHCNRDRKRGNSIATYKSYRECIHQAVERSEGKDEYTGKELDWKKISKYNNNDAARQGREYKRGFYDLPTVDHVGDGRGEADFKICSWQVNDAKHDQSLSEFIELCRSIVRFANDV